jgi:hypothetical protein
MKEQMSGSVTLHSVHFVRIDSWFAVAVGSEMTHGKHGEKGVRQGIASRRRHVAPALLLC